MRVKSDKGERVEVLGRNDGILERASEDPKLRFLAYLGATPPAVRNLRRFILEPHEGIPMHDHDGPDTEVLIPLSGLFRVTCGDGPQAEVGVGDVIVSAPGQAHAVANLTDAQAELLIFTTPSGDVTNP